MNIIKEIKWKLFMLKTRLWLVKHGQVDKYMRKNHCRFGYHKLRSEYVGYGGTGQRMKHIRFLRCIHCNYLFFAKKSDKERYSKYEERTKVNIPALLKLPSSEKPKRIKSSVEAKGKDVSVRLSS